MVSETGCWVPQLCILVLIVRSGKISEVFVILMLCRLKKKSLRYCSRSSGKMWRLPGTLSRPYHKLIKGKVIKEIIRILYAKLRKCLMVVGKELFRLVKMLLSVARASVFPELQLRCKSRLCSDCWVSSKFFWWNCCPTNNCLYWMLD